MVKKNDTVRLVAELNGNQKTRCTVRYSMKAEVGLGWTPGRLSEIQGVAKSKSLGLKLVLVFKCASVPWCVCVRRRALLVRRAGSA